MKATKNGFSVEVSGTDKQCPAGEKAGSTYIREGKIPVLSCEGACIRGEIARLAAHMIAKEEPYRRGCHGELLSVPGSALAQWMKNAERVVLIDGCFLHCHGRVFENMIGSDRLLQFDAYSYYKKYAEHFDIDSVPDAERTATARLVAAAVLSELRKAFSPDQAECGERCALPGGHGAGAGGYQCGDPLLCQKD